MQMLQQSNIEDIYPLTPLQEGIFFHYLYDSSPVYFCQTNYLVEGTLYIDKFHEAFTLLMQRYGQLRSVFVNRSGKLMQVILKEIDRNFVFKDLSSHPDPTLSIKEYKKADVEKRFQLEKEVPIRLTVFKIAPDKYEFIWSHHHIVMDGWCISILIADFMAIYKSLVKETKPQLKQAVSFSVYHKWLQSRDQNSATTFWKNYLDGFDRITYLSNEVNKNPGYKSYEIASVIPEETTVNLQEIARQNNTTLSILVQTVWGILLSKYTNATDVLFGAVVSGRPSEIEDVDTIVGLFINSVPVRINYEAHTTFSKLLKQTHKNFIASEEFHHHPLVEIQSCSKLDTNLFDHLLVFENYPVAEMLSQQEDNEQDLAFDIKDTEVVEQTNYGLNLLVHNRGDELVFNFKFNENQYTKNQVDKLSTYLTAILHTVAKQPAIMVNEINIASEEDKRTIANFNDTAFNHNEEVLISLFRDRAKTHPDNIALYFNDIAVSYAYLDKLSDVIAHKILSAGDEVPQFIPLIMERSVEMIASIFAIFKVNAAYVPIDPSFPKKRIDFILKDISAQLILTNQESFITSTQDLNCLLIDATRLNVTNSHPIDITVEPKDLAYAIYTSGSTGNPKGVMVSHAALSNRIAWMQQQYKLTSGDLILQKTPYTFDVSVWELVWWSGIGASLCIAPPKAEKDPLALINLIKKNKVKVIHFVPSMLDGFMQLISNPEDLKTVTNVFCSGEALKESSVKKFYQITKAHQTQLSNLYGPTEACIDVSYYDCPNSHTGEVPIGKPIHNIELYVLDSWGGIVPPGVEGELYIAGKGLANGYLNLSELSSETFFHHEILNKRVYKTGDMVKLREDGQLLYLGRKDFQVKIRGMRIELKEIENTMLQHPSVKSAVVVARKDSLEDYSLNLYYEANSKLSEEEITQFLQEQLPAAMIPQFVMQIDEIPVTKHGKVNTASLPLIVTNDLDSNELPSEETALKLAALWKQLLPNHQISFKMGDHFFKVGGHSLKAVQLLSLIQKQFGLEIEIQKLFENPTLKEMAREIKALQWLNQTTVANTTITKVKI